MESREEVLGDRLLNKPQTTPTLDTEFSLQKYNQENSSLSLEEEVKDLRSKLKIMTTKFQTTKKELADCKKENKELHSEVMQLQANIRSMVPGFQCTGSSFPLFAEL